MARITVYQKPTCSTCRAVHKILVDKGINVEYVDYYIDAIPKAKLRELIEKMGMSPRDLLRTKEPVYKELKLAEQSLSDDAILDLMTEYPDLLQRPIIEKGKRAILARPAERLLDFL